MVSPTRAQICSNRLGRLATAFSLTDTRPHHAVLYLQFLPASCACGPGPACPWVHVPLLIPFPENLEQFSFAG